MILIFSPALVSLVVILLIQIKDHFVATKQQPMLNQVHDALWASRFTAARRTVEL